MDQYDVLISVDLRVWDGDTMNPITCSFVRAGQLDHLAGQEMTVNEALGMARSILEAKSATLIRDLAAALLHMRHEQPVLPFP